MAPVCRVKVIRASRLYPVPTDEIVAAVRPSDAVLIADEGILSGGWCEAVTSALTDAGYRGRIAKAAVDGDFPPHGDIDCLMKRYGLDADGLARDLLKLAKK